MAGVRLTWDGTGDARDARCARALAGVVEVEVLEGMAP